MYKFTRGKFSAVIKPILNINLLDPVFPLNFIVNQFFSRSFGGGELGRVWRKEKGEKRQREGESD